MKYKHCLWLTALLLGAFFVCGWFLRPDTNKYKIPFRDSQYKK